MLKNSHLGEGVLDPNEPAVESHSITINVTMGQIAAHAASEAVQEAIKKSIRRSLKGAFARPLYHHRVSIPVSALGQPFPSGGMVRSDQEHLIGIKPSEYLVPCRWPAGSFESKCGLDAADPDLFWGQQYKALFR